MLKTCEEHSGAVVVYHMHQSCPACLEEEDKKEIQSRLDEALDNNKDLETDIKSKQETIDELMERIASFQDRL